MSQLNCSVGDLAITVFCKLPENCGNIVRVKAVAGIREWANSEDPLFTWEREIATEGGWLAYEIDGYLETHKIGPIPDKYLKRLTPPEGYVLEEFADSEPLQAELFTADLI